MCYECQKLEAKIVSECNFIIAEKLSLLGSLIKVWNLAKCYNLTLELRPSNFTDDCLGLFVRDCVKFLPIGYR